MKYNVYTRITRECGKRDLIKIDITENPDSYKAQYPDREFAFVPFGQKICQSVSPSRKRC